MAWFKDRIGFASPKSRKSLTSGTTLVRSQWIYRNSSMFYFGANVYTVFPLLVNVPKEQRNDVWEFRVRWFGNANLKVRNIGVTRVEWTAGELNHIANTGEWYSSNIFMPYLSYLEPVWRSRAGVHQVGTMTYGANTNLLPTGGHGLNAFYKLRIEAPDSSQTLVAQLQVYDVTTGVRVAYKDIYRSDVPLSIFTGLPDNDTYYTYVVPFTPTAAQAGHQFGFHVWWYGTTTVSSHSVGIL